MDITAIALKDRICDATDRIPTSRWAFYSETLECFISPGDAKCSLVFEADRDTLLTDLSISAIQRVTGSVPDGEVDIEYCNVVYAEHTDLLEWGYCCDRKPIFLVGVRENKRLRFDVVLDSVPIANGVDVQVTVSGFQGDGCCS